MSRAPRTASRDRLTVRSFDVVGTDPLDPLFAETDAVVVAIRLAPGNERALAPATVRLLDAADHAQVRVLLIGGAAPLRAPGPSDRLVADDPAYVPAAWRAVARASLEQFEACRAHRFTGWTYLSPPAVLEPGPRSGGYRRGTTRLLTDSTGDSRITNADLAIAVVDELETPGDDRHFTVAAGRGAQAQNFE